jgi:4-amino-4-deoxy-L-arabinose transferase-like glycosyltransferase
MENRRALGLLACALVLVGNALPLGYWELLLIGWLQSLDAPKDVLSGMLQTLVVAVGASLAVLLAICCIGMAAAALAVASGKAWGVRAGALGCTIVACFTGYLLYQNVPNSVRGWQVCLVANALAALYLLVRSWRAEPLPEDSPAAPAGPPPEAPATALPTQLD